MPLHLLDVQGPRYFLGAEAYRTLKRHKCRAPPAFTEAFLSSGILAGAAIMIRAHVQTG